MNAGRESAIVDADLETPRPGGWAEVAPRIFWIRLPLEGPVDHVNCWALDDDNGWTLIDFGTSTLAVGEAWERILAELIGQKPVVRLVATHGHSDHIGYAGTLAERFSLPMHAVRTEWLVAAYRRGEARSAAPAYVPAFFAMHGCSSDHAESYEAARRRWANEVDELPPLTAINSGDRLPMGGRTWQVLTVGGHSLEQALFWCAGDKLLFCADHLLPRTTPSLAVLPSHPDADPVGDFLASLDLVEKLPADTLVLPSHGRPYRGVRTRTSELRSHHQRRLADVLAATDVPRTAMQVAETVYPRAVADGRARLVFNEAIGRLNHLVARGAVKVERSTDGRMYFHATVTQEKTE